MIGRFQTCVCSHPGLSHDDHGHCHRKGCDCVRFRRPSYATVTAPPARGRSARVLLTRDMRGPSASG